MHSLKNIKAQQPPTNPKWKWGITVALAVLLLFMSVTQLLSISEFYDAVATYNPLAPKSVVVFSLIFLQLLAIPALLPIKLSKGLRFVSAYAALVLPILWTSLAIQAMIRGLDVPNCGCYGKYFAQELSGAILVQDAVFVAWGVFSFFTVKK